MDGAVGVVVGALAVLASLAEFADVLVAVEEQLAAVARLGVLNPIALEHVAVARLVRAVAVSLAVYKLTAVDVAVAIEELAVAVHAVVLPLAVVLASVDGHECLFADAGSKQLSDDVVARVRREYERAHAMALIVAELAVVHLAVVQRQAAHAVLHAVGEFALVLVAVAERQHAATVHDQLAAELRAVLEIDESALGLVSNKSF